MAKIRFYLGPSGSGKSFRLFSDLIRESDADPGRNCFVIVPEQFSLSVQKELIRLHPRHGIMNVDVLSFHRLAFRIFDETGIDPGKILDENGKNLLLCRIMQEVGDDLPHLASLLRRPDAADGIRSVLSEFMQYNTSAEDLLSEGGRLPMQLRGKLSDIAKIEALYREAIEGTYLNTDEVPLLLADAVPRSRLLEGSLIVFDGFTGFTPVQLPVLRALMEHADALYFTSTVEADADLSAPWSENDLFAMGRSMIRDILRLSEETKSRILPAVRVSHTEMSRAAGSRDLRFLERRLFRRTDEVFPGTPEHISFAAYPDPYAEVCAAARRVRTLVREKGLRWRDVAVLTGDLPSYGDLAKQIFPAEGIPLFVDTRGDVLSNPCVEFFRAAMQLCRENWSRASVMRLLRTGFLPVAGDDADRLDNYLLALGIRGRNRWSEPFTGHYGKEDPGLVLYYNGLRESILRVLLPFSEAFTARGGTAAQKTRALYDLGLACGVQQKMADLADAPDCAPEDAGPFRRIYPAVMDLFDKIVSTVDGIRMSVADFTALADGALSAIRLGVLPPSSDVVMVGDMQRTRIDGIRFLLFLGVNEGILPSPGNAPAILTESDRELLRECGRPLSPGPREEVCMHRFYLYLALTKPSEALFLSCARSSAGGEPLQPAYLLGVLRDLFPGLPVKDENIPSPREIETASDALRVLPALYRKAEDRDAAEDVCALCLAAGEDPVRGREADLFLAALTFHGPESVLPEETARKLYGNVLHSSATRLETFSRCAFSHFASYGLALSEREEFTYGGIDRGSILHKALEQFAGTLRAKDIPWPSLSDEERDSLAEKCVRDAAAVHANRLMYDTAASRYEISRLERLMKRTVWAVSKDFSDSDFVPAGIEYDFTAGGGGPVTLHGKIDRIDLCRRDGDVLVKIVDYKTGNTGFSLPQIHAGLQRQLIVYLSAALRRAEEESGLPARPAGILYFLISDPVVDDVPEGPGREERIAGAILNKLKQSGVVSDDPEILGLLDHHLAEPGGTSRSVPASVTKTGTLGKRSSVFSDEDFETVSRYMAHSIRRDGSRILRGEIAAVPFRMGQTTACGKCPFRSVCGFDEKLPACHYRVIENDPPEEILEQMRKEVSDALD